MKLNAFFACVLLLAVTVVSCQRSRNEPSYATTDHSEFVCERFNRKIRIFRPKGLELQQKVTSNLQSIELEVYINQNYQSHPSCDICVNTTVSNRRQRKLIIKNSSIVVLPGDTVQYSITKHYRYGPPKRFSCELQVVGADMIISYGTKSTTSCSINVPLRQRHNYATEKTLLEQTINALLSSCEGMDVTNTLVLAGEYKGIESETALKRYVVDRLNTLLPSVDWSETVENVYHSHERIVFTVKTVLIKLKILHSIRETVGAKMIIDFEDLSRSARYYDDSDED